MDRYDLEYAREHLAELIERASKGEEVTIRDPAHGDVRFKLVPAGADERRRPRLGLLEGKMKVPERLFEPLSEEELKDWYGEEQ